MDVCKIKQFASDPLAFFNDINIPTGIGSRRFGDAMAPFQREWIKAIAPSLIAITKGERPPIGRFWTERTKGGSKDSDVTLALVWLMAFSRRPLEMEIAAGDRDQAAEVVKIAKGLLRTNEWLAQRIEIQSKKLVCEATGCEAEIISSDSKTAHGARPDVLFINELVHHKDREFAETLADNAAKVPGNLMIVATNAGHLNTWQHTWRENARESERWHFHKVDQPSPWLDEAEIEEALRRNSASRFARLWKGVWGTGEDGALNPQDVEKCITLEGVTNSFSANPGSHRDRATKFP